MYLLFAHGLESGPWGRKSLALRDAGHEVVSPDCRGLDLEARVGVLLEALRAADPVPLVVGSSFGGIAALLAVAWAAAEGLAVPGLVLCAPALAVPAPARWRIATRPPCPAVILHGREDLVVPLADSQRFASAHGLELVELDDGHSLARSIDPLLAAVERLASSARPARSGLGRSFEHLIGMITHDLRNPLGTVQLTAELSRASTTDARATKQAQRIVDNVGRMVGVLEQAQQYAEVLAQASPRLQAEAIDVADVVAAIVTTLRPEDQPRVEVSSAGDSVGRWDPSFVTRMLFEVLDNALGYRSDDGPVLARIDGTRAEQLVVHIENAGEITAARRGELFVPYASRKAPRPHGMRRLGLGLVLVRRWAELLGASFGLESSGQRTIASIVLPRALA